VVFSWKGATGSATPTKHFSQAARHREGPERDAGDRSHRTVERPSRGFPKGHGGPGALHYRTQAPQVLAFSGGLNFWFTSPAASPSLALWSCGNKVGYPWRKGCRPLSAEKQERKLEQSTLSQVAVEPMVLRDSERRLAQVGCLCSLARIQLTRGSSSGDDPYLAASHRPSAIQLRDLPPYPYFADCEKALI
jgi:hypothetical protein